MNKWFQECSLAKQKGVGGGGEGVGEPHSKERALIINVHFS